MNKTKLLIECKKQLEYLNEKFGETGTTNSLLSKLGKAIDAPAPTREEVIDVVVEDIFIRGIDLEDYRREIASVYESLCKLFSTDPHTELKVEQERIYYVPYWLIAKKCGWIKFCEVTGTNEWALNEGLANTGDKFPVTESQGEKLGL